MGTLWSGQRPVSADGVPIVCRASPTLSNVWLNAGHGSMGFKFSCGTAQMLAWLLQKVCVAWPVCVSVGCGATFRPVLLCPACTQGGEEQFRLVFSLT